MSFFQDWFGKPAIESNVLQEYERAEFDRARDVVIDELRIAVVDANGRRFKEREIDRAIRTVGRL